MLLNKPIPARYILYKIKREMMYVLAVSLLVLYLTEEYGHAIPDMPLTIPAFIGTAISILLSFKLNQSYDRWWEARKVWGSVVNDSRSLVLQLQAFVSPGNEDIVRRMAYRQIAWCYALGRSLRQIEPLTGLEHLIEEQDLREAGEHRNKPLALLSQHSRDLKRLREAGQLELFSQVQIDETLVRLCDSQGRAERIKSTVFPVTYRKFLHFIIYLFVITLSISLKDVGGLFELPLLIMISAAFFLLERSATHMQDPFENKPTDTAMTTISKNIEINLRQLLGEKEIHIEPEPEKYYAL